MYNLHVYYSHHRYLHIFTYIVGVRNVQMMYVQNLLNQQLILQQLPTTNKYISILM